MVDSLPSHELFGTQGGRTVSIPTDAQKRGTILFLHELHGDIGYDGHNAFGKRCEKVPLGAGDVGLRCLPYVRVSMGAVSECTEVGDSVTPLTGGRALRIDGP